MNRDSPGHPRSLQDVLLPVPIFLLTATLVTDLLFVGTGTRALARLSFLLIVAGMAAGLLAALAAAIELLARYIAGLGITGQARYAGQAGALVLSAANLVLRRAHLAAPIKPWGIVLSAAAAVLLTVVSWALT